MEEQTAAQAGIEIDGLNLVEASSHTFDLEIKHPDERPMGPVIQIIGGEAEDVQKFVRRELNARIQKRALAERRNKTESVPVEEEIEFAIESALKRTVGWRGFLSGGQPWPFTPENARRLYKMNPHIRQQVIDASNDVSNFLKR